MIRSIIQEPPWGVVLSWTSAAEVGVERGHSGWELTLEDWVTHGGVKGRRGNRKSPCGSGLDEWVGSEVIIEDGEYKNRKSTLKDTLWPDGDVQQVAEDTGLKLRRGVKCHSLCHFLISHRGGQLSRREKRCHWPCPQCLPWLPSVGLWERASIISYAVSSLDPPHSLSKVMDLSLIKKHEIFQYQDLVRDF